MLSTRSLLRLLILTFLITVCAFSANNADRFFRAGKARILILSGRNNHDWRTTTPFLRRILEATGRFDTRVDEEPAGITTDALEPYQAIVVDYDGPRWGSTAEQAVEGFVRGGKGLVVVHGASYAFGDMELLGDNHVPMGFHEPPWAEWERMIGAAWRMQPKSGHAPRHVFIVKWQDRSHPICAGMPATFVGNDEIYHQLRLQPNIHVLATAYDDPKPGGTGRDEPVLWTVNYGTGRVFYTALGHDVAAMMETGFMASFARGTEWAATGGVTLPAAVTLDPASPHPVRTMVVTGGHDHVTSFYSLFTGGDLRVTVNPHPAAYVRDLRPDYDVLVLYDMIQQLDDVQRKNLRDFVEAGKGVVALHNSIADFNDWTWWWHDVVGGRYLLKPDAGMPASTYKHDVEQAISVVADHPVTHGLPPFHLADETYHGMWISPDVEVLLRSDAPTSDGPVAWISPYRKSRVVFIELGHDRQACNYPPYRQLVHNAIVWAAGR